MHQNHFLNRAWIVAMLLAGIFLAPKLPAQPTEQTVQSRFLFVFETSRDMKPRLDETEKALKIALALSLSGQMHAGDSMGVWTFGQTLRPGDYPLQAWNPNEAALTASNLVQFLEKQSYSKSGDFAVLQPLLNQVVRNSERLTVLIFCAGSGTFGGTPFDTGINQLLEQKVAAQKKAKQPFVIVFRSQLGQYVGCTVNLPPDPLNYPQFPPLPAPPPPPPPPKATNVPPPAPVIMGQPLIIIGNKNESNPPTNAAQTNAPPATNPPPVIPSPVVPSPATNTETAPSINQVLTNLTEPPTPPTNLTAAANPPAPAPPAAGFVSRPVIIIGAGLLVAVLAMTIFFRRRSRRPDDSLITRSMDDPK